MVLVATVEEDVPEAKKVAGEYVHWSRDERDEQASQRDDLLLTVCDSWDLLFRLSMTALVLACDGGGGEAKTFQNSILVRLLVLRS